MEFSSEAIRLNYLANYLFIIFIIKHFIVDFCLQTKYQYSNKGTFGHPGGLLHSFLHGLATFNIIAIVGYFINFNDRIWIAVICGVIDSVIHYFVDYGKVNINVKFNLKPDNSNLFWVLLGLDQALHFFTYGFIIILFISRL